MPRTKKSKNEKSNQGDYEDYGNQGGGMSKISSGLIISKIFLSASLDYCNSYFNFTIDLIIYIA